MDYWCECLLAKCASEYYVAIEYIVQVSWSSSSATYHTLLEALSLEQCLFAVKVLGTLYTIFSIIVFLNVHLITYTCQTDQIEDPATHLVKDSCGLLTQRKSGAQLDILPVISGTV